MSHRTHSRPGASAGDFQTAPKLQGGALRLARWGCVLFLAVTCARTVSGAVPDTSPPRVLILAPTVITGLSSQEAVIALGQGFQVDVVTPAQWGAMTATTGAPYNPAKGFSAYRALVLGDPNCTVVGNAAIIAAEANRTVWSPAANGNVIIMGEDFSYHANISVPGAQRFLTNAIQFATADPTKTGLFASLSCYYLSAAAGTPVPVLDKLSTPANQVVTPPYYGPFTVRGGGFEQIHITAAHPSLAGLTDALLSNYGSSSHETFDTWPADFIPLAIATDSAPIYTGGVPPMRGSPYIMVRGLGVTAVGNSCLSITNKAVDCLSTNHTYAWSFCVTNVFNGPVGFLSLLDLPAGVTVSKDLIPLTPALQPGQGACLTVYVTNTPGLTNICFTIGAHSTNFNFCCAITNCLTFVPCCTFVPTETLTPIPGQPNCYTYALTVRNVSTDPIKYIFFSEDPLNGCLTFTPDIITLPTVLPAGGQVAVSVKVCINPACAKPLCFLLSIHNTNLVMCCSSRHCLPPTTGPIKVVNPADGTLFYTPAVIPLGVTLTPDVAFSSVTYRANGLVVASNSIPPFSAVWSNGIAGNYAVTADGVETAGGGVWTSDPATIYVRTDEHGGSGLAPNGLVLSTIVNGDQLHFSFTTQPGVTCCVEFTESLANPVWQVLGTKPGDGTIMLVIDSVTNAPQRFYRARMY